MAIPLELIARAAYCSDGLDKLATNTTGSPTSRFIIESSGFAGFTPLPSIVQSGSSHETSSTAELTREIVWWRSARGAMLIESVLQRGSPLEDGEWSTTRAAYGHLALVERVMPLKGDANGPQVPVRLAGK